VALEDDEPQVLRRPPGTVQLAASRHDELDRERLTYLLVIDRYEGGPANDSRWMVIIIRSRRVKGPQ